MDRKRGGKERGEQGSGKVCDPGTMVYVDALPTRLSAICVNFVGVSVLVCHCRPVVYVRGVTSRNCQGSFTRFATAFLISHVFYS